MHKAVGKLISKAMGQGEKAGPVKSIKVKIKFQKKDSKNAEKSVKKLGRAMKGYKK